MYPVRRNTPFYPRYSYRNYRSQKYSNETIAFNADLIQEVDAGDNWPINIETNEVGITIVPPTDILGNRKVKNFTLKVTANGNDDQIFGALVYVPEGTEASKILCTGSTQSLYEPNQNVILTFVIPPNVLRAADGSITMMSAPTQIVCTSRLARNLNTGDKIVLLFSSPNGMPAGDGTGDNPPPMTCSGTVNFAIKY